MSVYRRYFIIETGSVIKKLMEVNAINEKAVESYLAILKEIGAKTDMYYKSSTGERMTGFDFERGQIVDSKLFKRVRSGWMPKLNSKKGKEIHERIEAVVTVNKNDVLHSLGLDPFVIFPVSGYNLQYCNITLIPFKNKPKAVLSVPWSDEPKKSLEAYRKDKNTSDGYMDHLLWEPTSDLKEVKKWEYLKIAEDYNSSTINETEAKGRIS